MSQKSSVPQAVSFVSQVLKRDSTRAASGNPGRNMNARSDLSFQSKEREPS